MHAFLQEHSPFDMEEEQENASFPLWALITNYFSMVNRSRRYNWWLGIRQKQQMQGFWWLIFLTPKH